MTLQEFWQEIEPMLFSFGKRLVGAIIVLILGRILIGLVLRGVRKGRLSKHADPMVARFLVNFLSIGLNILLIVSIIGILGVPMSSVVAVIASAAVAIGLALQGALSNFAGSIMILIFRPFHLDDYVELGDVSGTVKDIGLFYTVLDTPDNRVVTIPNGSVMNNQIINYSVRSTRRLDLPFSVAYGSDIAKVREVLLETAANHDLVLTDPAPFARLKATGTSSLDFILRVWVKKENYWQVNFDLLEQVVSALTAAGIKIPYQQMDVHIKGEMDNGRKR